LNLVRNSHKIQSENIPIYMYETHMEDKYRGTVLLKVEGIFPFNI
jgi:hypothetical protein